MPRDGSGIYTKPFPDVVEGTTIESAVHNGTVSDIETDLNAARPIIAGGTGATNAVDAATNLGVVTGKTAIVYTEAEKTQARANIYAAPLDALAYNGMQFNGSMEVSQELGLAGRTTAGYIADGWSYISPSAPFVGAAGQLAAAITNIGLKNCIYIQVTTPKATMTGTDYLDLQQIIEGFRFLRMGWGTPNALPLTIGFWSCHDTAGTHTVCVRNSPTTHSYPATYTHAVGGAWQYNAITIPGSTAGTWNKSNDIGAIIDFTAACGPTYTAPVANAWNAGVFVAAPGQVNGGASLNFAFRITGVVVLPGTQAPTAAQSPLIMRPYDQELVTCQRYWRYLKARFDGPKTAGVGVSRGFPLFPGMRVAPTITVGAFSHAGVDGTISRGSATDLIFLSFTASSTGGYVFNEDDALDARL